MFSYILALLAVQPGSFGVCTSVLCPLSTLASLHRWLYKYATEEITMMVIFCPSADCLCCAAGKRGPTCASGVFEKREHVGVEPDTSGLGRTRASGLPPAASAVTCSRIPYWMLSVMRSKNGKPSVSQGSCGARMGSPRVLKGMRTKNGKPSVPEGDALVPPGTPFLEVKGAELA
jgi:hypothetical protein